MQVKEKLAQHEMFDVAILLHGFAPHMRDYEVIVEMGGGNRGRYRYRFTHCTETHLITRITDSVWRESWDDLFIDHQDWLDAGSPPGFVWGVCWSSAYPGLSYIDNSELAANWSERLGMPMHEVMIETQVFSLKLIFHDVIIEMISDEVSIIDKVSIPISV